MIRSTNRCNFNGHKTRTAHVQSVCFYATIQSRCVPLHCEILKTGRKKNQKQNEIDSLYSVNITLSNASENEHNDAADWMKLTEILQLLSTWMTHAYHSVGILMRIYIHIRNKQYRLVCVYTVRFSGQYLPNSQRHPQTTL